MVTTGLLAFGAGLLVNEVFDDDDDWDDYYPNYGHGGMYHGGGPYYPPPPYMYRPPYGGGYYPSNGYNRPPNYQHGFNNNTIIVNNGGNDYWKRNGSNSTRVDTRPAKSPITAAKPNRAELNDLNRQASERARTQAQRPDTRQAQSNQARQTGYAGARPENKAARDKMVQNSPKPAGVARICRSVPRAVRRGKGSTRGEPTAGSSQARHTRTAQATSGRRNRSRSWRGGGREAISVATGPCTGQAGVHSRAAGSCARAAGHTDGAGGPAASIIRTATIWRRGIQCQQREAGACRARGQSARPLQQASGAKSSGGQSGGGKRPGR